MGIVSKILREKLGKESSSPKVLASKQNDAEKKKAKVEKCLPFNELPEHVIHKIVSKLNWEDKKTCRLVCSQWEELVRLTVFREKNICCEYRAGEGPRGVTSAAIWHEIFEKFRRHPKTKLQFSTFRIKNISRLSIRFFQSWLFVKSLSNFSLQVKCVTRLELDPFLTTNLSDNERVYEIWNNLLPVFSNFENMVELIIAQPGTKDSAFPLPDGFLLFTNDLPHRYVNLCRKYRKDLKKLRRLKVLVFSVDFPKISEYLVFLELVGSFATSLVELKVRVNYSMIFTVEFARNSFYSAIGSILKNNASTLEKVHLGTLNVDLGQKAFPGHPIVSKNYASHISNEMFDRLLDQMEERRWKDFDLNKLELLTIDLPVPVLPSARIEATLLPFLHSLKKLKVVKIQPVVQRNHLLRSRSLPPYLDSIFPKTSNSNYYPRMESDIIFFSDSSCCAWPNLRENCHHSVIDLVFRANKRDDHFNSKPRSYHERNVSWKNTLFSKSIIAEHLPFLTQLIIFQDISVCPKERQVYIGNSEMQLILRDGIYLQSLILNCNMDDLTHFGYTGLSPLNVALLKSNGFSRSKLSRKLQTGYSILDLKCLRHLILFGLKGHNKLPETAYMYKLVSWKNNSFWADRVDFVFISQYLNSMYLKTLYLRYELSTQYLEGYVKYIYEPFPNPLMPGYVVN